MGAQDADLAAGTTSQPGGGSHLHVGQHEVPAMELRTPLTGAAAPDVQRAYQSDKRDGHCYSHLLRPGVERRDVLRQHLGTGQRQGMVVDDKGMVVSEPVDVDLGEVRQSSLPDQSGTSGAYAQRSQGDGG